MKNTPIRLAALVVLTGSCGLLAQNAPLLKHSVELNAFMGYTYGINEQAIESPSRVVGGGTVSYSLTKWLLPYFEVGYFPGIDRSFEGTAGGTGTRFRTGFNIPLTDIHGGVHLRIPIKESPLVPYIVFGAGVLRASKSTYTFEYPGLNNETLRASVPVDAASYAAVNFGGGFRYYITRHVGVRLEGKAYHAGGDALKSTFGKLEGGFFLQFGGTR